MSVYGKNRSPANSKSPKTSTQYHIGNQGGKSPDLVAAFNCRTEAQRKELMMAGANMPLSSNRPGVTDPEGASGYGEYLRGSNTDLLDSSAAP